MSVIDIHPNDVPPPLPNLARAYAAAEVEVVEILRAAGKEQEAKIKSAIHSRSGVLAGSVGVSVRRVSGGGAALRFGSIKKGTFASRKSGDYTASRKHVFYDHFVDQGTGIYGPAGKRISNRGLIRIGNVLTVPSGNGQKPQRMFQHAAEDFLSVSPTLDGPIDAVLTREIERVSR